MSFSNRVNLENPCTKYIDYKGDKGEWSYYDKEQKSNFEIKDFKFIVLDELNAIGGFHKPSMSGIYSNEVYHLEEETLNVKSFKSGLHLTGLYKDLKDSITTAGGKFVKSVYAVLVREGGGITDIVNFRMKGSALKGWFDKPFKPYDKIISVKEYLQEKNGSVNYLVPVFDFVKLEDQTLIDLCTEQDKILQEYLKSYISNNKKREIETTPPVKDVPPILEDHTADVDVEPKETDKLPF